MAALKNVIRSGRSAWLDFWLQAAPLCDHCDSLHRRNRWRRMRHRSSAVRLAGKRYCGGECVKHALLHLLADSRPAPRPGVAASHRVPLGLILLSRQQLTPAQLRSALEAQRRAGHGRIGDWLRQLGFSDESEITAALARQWCCPILRSETALAALEQYPAIPVRLLETFRMIPVELADSAGTLLVAFSDAIDYSALYAVEQMLGCRTEPCFVSGSILGAALEALSGRKTPGDIIFDRVQNDAECVQIIASYIAKVNAHAVRVARCGAHLWARLDRRNEPSLNLLLTASGSSATAR